MNRKGQALVEFVLILPIFIMILFSIVDFGIIFNKKNELENISIDIINLLNNNNKLMIIEIAVFSIIVIIPSVIYAFNPPSLFGYLTTDNTLCDLTEAAFVWYLVRMSVSLITGIIFIVLVVNERINIKCMYIIAGTLLVLSLAMLIVSGLNRASLSVMYMLCAVADVIGVIVLAVTGLRTLS